MQPVKLKLSSDGAHASLAVSGVSVDLSASNIDNLIRDLAAVRAKMDRSIRPSLQTTQQSCITAIISSGA